MTVEELYGEDAHYIDEDSAAAIEQVPAHLWAALQETMNDLVEGCEIGVDYKIAVTHETMEHFEDARKNHWVECGGVEPVNGPLKAVQYLQVQIAKGHQRKEIVVVDLGETRAVLLSF